MPVAKQPDENKVAHAMTTHRRLVTHEWRHRINLKKYFIDEPTHEQVDSLCKLAISQN